MHRGRGKQTSKDEEGYVEKHSGSGKYTSKEEEGNIEMQSAGIRTRRRTRKKKLKSTEGDET